MSPNSNCIRNTAIHFAHVPKAGGSNLWHQIASAKSKQNKYSVIDPYHETRKAVFSLSRRIVSENLLTLNRDDIASLYHLFHDRCITNARADFHEQRFLHYQQLGIKVDNLYGIYHWHLPGTPFIKLTPDIKCKDYYIISFRSPAKRLYSHAAHLIQHKQHLMALLDGESPLHIMSLWYLNDLSLFDHSFIDDLIRLICSPSSKPSDLALFLISSNPSFLTYQTRYFLSLFTHNKSASEAYDLSWNLANEDVIRLSSQLIDSIASSDLINALAITYINSDGNFIFSERFAKLMDEIGLDANLFRSKRFFRTATSMNSNSGASVHDFDDFIGRLEPQDLMFLNNEDLMLRQLMDLRSPRIAV